MFFLVPRIFLTFQNSLISPYCTGTSQVPFADDEHEALPKSPRKGKVRAFPSFKSSFL